MGTIKPPRKVKLLVGILSEDRDLVQRARQLLCKCFGDTDFSSDYYPFDASDYYEEELGENPEKSFLSFDQLIRPDGIVEVKRETNELEKQICHDLALPHDLRPVNLDPGYMSLSKLVLATTKDFSHRIYIQRGIYAEVTLRYRDGNWQSWPWTYPDYASGIYSNFFTQMRERLKDQLAG